MKPVRIQGLIDFLKRLDDSGKVTFAEASETSLGNLVQISYGHGRASAELAMRISKKSHWAVTPHQLRPDLYPDPTDGLPRHLKRKLLVKATVPDLEDKKHVQVVAV
jgi:hypothetical protein